MGNFRSNNRGGYGGRPGGSRFGGRPGGRGRFGGRDSERRPREMYDTTCSKCGKRCQIPFKPTGNKPVFCSDCFKQNEGSGNNFNSRNQDKQAPVSSEQFNQINKKLDKIISILQELEIEVEEDFDEGEDEDLDEDSEDEESEDESISKIESLDEPEEELSEDYGEDSEDEPSSKSEDLSDKEFEEDFEEDTEDILDEDSKKDLDSFL